MEKGADIAHEDADKEVPATSGTSEKLSCVFLYWRVQLISNVGARR
jgi:hypothetical protein